jgi:hypothetical protein
MVGNQLELVASSTHIRAASSIRSIISRSVRRRRRTRIRVIKDDLQRPICFEAIGLSHQDLLRLRHTPVSDNAYASVFAVFAMNAGPIATKSSVPGTYSINDSRLTFVPHQPLLPDVTYRAILHIRDTMTPAHVRCRTSISSTRSKSPDITSLPAESHNVSSRAGDVSPLASSSGRLCFSISLRPFDQNCAHASLAVFRLLFANQPDVHENLPLLPQRRRRF